MITNFLIRRIAFEESTHRCPATKMFWQPILSLVAFFFRGFHAPPVNDIYYNATPYGPQSWEEAEIAMQALQGQNDMMFSEDWPESAGHRDERFRWTGYPGSGVVPYVIDKKAQHMKSNILQAMEQYHRQTCIKFVPRTNQKDYVHIVSLPGCASFVGKKGGVQQLRLGKGCHHVGTIVHELGHAIGLYHEHQRSDRDQYIKFNRGNVRPALLHNFDKTDPSKENTFGATYDYTSIMHYGEYAFSKRPQKLKTMEAKNGTPLMDPYQRPGLNSNDVELVRKMYKC